MIRRSSPQNKGIPAGGDAHAAKDEGSCCLEQCAAAFFPFGFRADDGHAVGAKRKDREGGRVGERRLTIKTFDEWGKMRVTANPPRERGDNVEVPEARMVGTDVPHVFQGHKPLSKDIGTYVKHVCNLFPDVIWKAMEVECDRSKRDDFHHCPDGRIVRDAIFGYKVLYLRVIGCLVRGIGYSCKKPFVLCRRQFRHVRRGDVSERIADKVGMASGYYGANRYFDPREGVHRHQAQVTVEHVDVPDGFKRGVRTVDIGIRHSERVEIASESVVPHGFQYPKKFSRISDEASVLK